MFNSELKERYIKESNFTESREKYIRRLFNAIEKYERQWGSDICTRTALEIQPVADAISGFKSSSWGTTISYLHKYGEWCLENVPGATDALLQIRVVTDSKIKTQMVATPEQLQEYLNAVFEPESQKKIDNTYRCYYWLAYAGMKEDDIFLVKSSGVNFLHMIVEHDGYEFPIYDPSLPAMMNCVVLTAFSSTATSLSRDNPFIQRGSGDVLIRGTKPNPAKGTIKPLLSRLSKDAVDSGRTTLKMTYNRVWLSGLFYRMYEREQSGIKVSFTWLASEQLHAKAKDNPQRVITKKEINDKSSSFLMDYKRWKKAFYSE